MAAGVKSDDEGGAAVAITSSYSFVFCGVKIEHSLEAFPIINYRIIHIISRMELKRYDVATEQLGP